MSSEPTGGARELPLPAALALRSLADFPCRATASGISNSPRMVGSFGPSDVHRHLLELARRGLVAERAGRWRITAEGSRRATSARR